MWWLKQELYLYWAMNLKIRENGGDPDASEESKPRGYATYGQPHQLPGVVPKLSQMPRMSSAELSNFEDRAGATGRVGQSLKSAINKLQIKSNQNP